MLSPASQVHKFLTTQTTYLNTVRFDGSQPSKSQIRLNVPFSIYVFAIIAIIKRRFGLDRLVVCRVASRRRLFS